VKVSIVTISLNQREYLERAIQSVLRQEGVDLEYIVLDAGSTDGSRELIDAYRERFARVIFEPDRGPADGLNKAFAHATGEIVTWVNADDELLPGAAAAAAAMFERDPALDVVYGDGYLVGTDAGSRRRFRSTTSFGPRRYVYGWTVLLQQAAFVRLEAMRQVGGFNDANRTNWDGELFLRLALDGARFRHARQNWGCFRIHPNSITGSDRLNAEYAEQRRKLFREVVGRDPNAFDRALMVASAPQKWIRDPVGLIQRINDEWRAR